MLVGRHTFRRLCEARERLIEIPEERLLVREVARDAGISPYHFIRQFEAVFGATPHQYRIRSRLDRARLLLARDEHSITEVCMELGFSSLGTFSQLFTDRTGESPSEFRKRARILVPVAGQIQQVLFPGCLSLMRFLPDQAFRNFQEAPGDSHQYTAVK